MISDYYFWLFGLLPSVPCCSNWHALFYMTCHEMYSYGSMCVQRKPCYHALGTQDMKWLRYCWGHFISVQSNSVSSHFTHTAGRYSQQDYGVTGGTKVHAFIRCYFCVQKFFLLLPVSATPICIAPFPSWLCDCLEYTNLMKYWRSACAQGRVIVLA